MSEQEDRGYCKISRSKQTSTTSMIHATPPKRAITLQLT